MLQINEVAMRLPVMSWMIYACMHTVAPPLIINGDTYTYSSM